MYTPFPCVTGETDNCEQLVAYARIGIKETS